MKALEILKNLQIDVKKDIEAEGIEVFGYIDTAIDEAIKELEALENRSCESCKYYKEQNKTYCNGFEQDEECLRFVDDIHKIPCKDFCCNEWESK